MVNIDLGNGHGCALSIVDDVLVLTARNESTDDIAVVTLTADQGRMLAAAIEKLTAQLETSGLAVANG